MIPQFIIVDFNNSINLLLPLMRHQQQFCILYLLLAKYNPYQCKLDRLSACNIYLPQLKDNKYFSSTKDLIRAQLFSTSMVNKITFLNFLMQQTFIDRHEKHQLSLAVIQNFGHLKNSFYQQKSQPISFVLLLFTASYS